MRALVMSPLLLMLVVAPAYIQSATIRRSHKRLKHKNEEKVLTRKEKELAWREINEVLSPKERAQRERWAANELKALEKVCVKFAKFTPCACHEILTNAKIHRDHKITYLEYPEYTCSEKENRKRKADGRIAPGYTCAQLKTRRTLYRDEYEQPIEMEVIYRAGCELRCINTGCPAVTGLNKTNDDSNDNKRLETSDNDKYDESKDDNKENQDRLENPKTTKDAISADNQDKGGKRQSRENLNGEQGKDRSEKKDQILVVSETVWHDGSGMTLYRNSKKSVVELG